MASVNKVMLVGNLTRDVELRYTPKGTAVGKFGLAMNRKWTDDDGQQKEEVVFVDVDVWGKTAENTAQYTRKGDCIHVEGRLKLDQWDDKQTGQKRSRIGVVAERVKFLITKGEGAPREERAASRGAAPATGRQRYAQPEPGQPPIEGDGPPPVDDSDIPF